MDRAFVFPGQGSQFVAMGKEIYENFPAGKQVFQEVDNALNENLTKLIFEGPIEDLTQTRNTQPALMAVSLAIVKAIESETKQPLNKLCKYVAGHSLGEYSALCAANAISISDTAKLLRIRGNAMTEAVPTGKGSMAALIGVEFEQAEQIAKTASPEGNCQAANDNGGGQVVVSGSVEAIDKVIAIAAQFGAKKAVKLPVSAPFHSKFMEPAADIMRQALAETLINTPTIAVIANVTADIVTNPDEIRDLLVQQVTGMVRWRESIIRLKQLEVEQIQEIGAGKVLSGLIKRIDKDINSSSIQNPEDISNFLKNL
jgi:[acyl-carrier-protein] S-malonyltransferase